MKLKSEYPLMEEAGSTATSGTGGATNSSPAPAASEPAASEPAATEVVDNASGPSTEDAEFFASADTEDDESGAPSAAVVVPAKPAAPAPAAPAQPAAAPAAAQPAAPAKPAEAQPAAAPAAQPAQPDAPVAETPEAKKLREDAEAAEEKKYFDKLTEFYKIPDDMAAKLQTEPEVALPLLAAKVHHEVLKGVRNYLENQLPYYIQHNAQVSSREAASKDAFYKANPDLAPYEQQVLQAGKLYRQMNPKADAATSIKAIGEIVRASMGLQAPAASGAVPAPAANPAPAAGFRPAGAGGAAAAAAPAPAASEWDEMSRED